MDSHFTFKHAATYAKYPYKWSYKFSFIKILNADCALIYLTVLCRHEGE